MGQGTRLAKLLTQHLLSVSQGQGWQDCWHFLSHRDEAVDCWHDTYFLSHRDETGKTVDTTLISVSQGWGWQNGWHNTYFLFHRDEAGTTSDTTLQAELSAVSALRQRLQEGVERNQQLHRSLLGYTGRHTDQLTSGECSHLPTHWLTSSEWSHWPTHCLTSSEWSHWLIHWPAYFWWVFTLTNTLSHLRRVGALADTLTMLMWRVFMLTDTLFHSRRVVTLVDTLTSLLLVSVHTDWNTISL